MKALAFTLVVVAAGLAGCSGGTRSPLYTPGETPLPPGEGMLGDALTYDSRKRVATPATPATAAEQEEFRKWRESAGGSERREFEEWRAWQEWKRNNPK